MTDINLKLTATDDLLDELTRRYESALIVLDRDCREPDEEDIEVRGTGGHARTIGLAVLALVSVIGHYNEGEM